MIFTFTTEEPDGPFGRLAYDVAVELARWGYRVLYVGWSPSGGPGGVAALIADRLDPLDVVRTVGLPGDRSIDVIVGGTADRLPGNQEDWARAYADGVADFLEHCAERWQAGYEVVVIQGGLPGDPSRAIAVAHLPDAVVLDCHGSEAAALHAASESRDLLPYGRAQLSVVPLHGNAEDYERWTLPWVHATVRPERVADLAAGDVRVLAALLANGLAGTDLLVADPEAYVFAAEHRDGILEAARAVRPELAPGHDLDRVLRELLTTHPTPVARVRDVLVSDARLGPWLDDLLADPEFRPAEARAALSADAPVRHRCPIDGNYVWYRPGGDPVRHCPDHRVALEAAPLARRVDAAALRASMADRVGAWVTTGDLGARLASELEEEVLDLLAATMPEHDLVAATAAMSELQRAALLTGTAAEEARALASALCALPGTDALLGDLRSEPDPDPSAVYDAAGSLWRAARSRNSPGLEAWAAALVTGGRLDAGLLLDRMSGRLGRAAETGDNALLEEALFLGTTAFGALVDCGDVAATDLSATTASALVRWHAAPRNADALSKAIDELHSTAEAGSAWPFLPVILQTALIQRHLLTRSQADLDEAVHPSERAQEPRSGSSRTAAHRTIMAVDVVGYNDLRRTMVHRQAMHEGLWSVLRTAFAESGIPWDVCSVENTGDGASILVPREIATADVAAELPERLFAGLRRYNAVHADASQLRLRLALHTGDVGEGGYGSVSSAVSFTFRLLDAPAAKTEQKTAGADLAVVVSDSFYQDVVRHEPAANPGEYRRIPLAVKETDADGWLRLLGSPARAGQSEGTDMSGDSVVAVGHYVRSAPSRHGIAQRRAIEHTLVLAGFSDRSNRRLMLDLIHDILGYPLADVTGRDQLIAIVEACSRIPGGMNALLEAVEMIRPGSPEAALLRTVIEISSPPGQLAEGTSSGRGREGRATAESRISVMVVDDHPAWRDGVVRDLTEHGFDVRATAPDAGAAVRIARTVRPDVVLMDLNLGNTSGVDATREITSALPSTKVLVLSASEERKDVLEAVKAGASGYLAKSAPAAELIDAVYRTAAGDPVFSAGLASLVLGGYRRMADMPVPGAEPLRLTKRETEVLRLIAEGLTARQIAERLVLSHRTVENHVQSALRKLRLHNRVELARHAIEHGLDEE